MVHDLSERLREWQAADLLSASQAEAIAAHERRRGAPAGHDRGAGSGAAPDADPGRRSAVAEVVGYLGGTLAVIAAGILAERVWVELSPGARVALSAVVTVVLLAAGAWVRRLSSGAAARRLVAVLWTGAVAATALTAGILGGEVWDLRGDDVTLLTALAATAVAFPLHRLSPTSVQLVALAIGVVVLAVAALTRPVAEVDPFYVGLLLWGLGVACAVLAAGGWLPPTTTGVVLGVLGVGVGAEVATAGRHTGLGLTLGLVSTGAVLALATLGRSTVLLGLGVLGVVVFVPHTVFHLFGDALGAPVALLLTGLLLVAIALGLLTLRREVAEEAT